MSFFQSIKLLLNSNKKFYGLFYSDFGFIPKNKRLYSIALTHRSASFKTKSGSLINNERLEFLGDAIIEAVVTEFLYKFFPEKDEGFLTQLRSKIVNRDSLNAIAIKMGIKKYLVAKFDVEDNKHVFGDAFEAFVGAIFLDQGYYLTKSFINKFIFKNYIDIKELVREDRNYKSRLIEWAQKYKVELSFKVSDDTDTNNKFRCKIFVSNKFSAESVGFSKKNAEQQAASIVVKNIEKEAEGYLEI